MSTADRDVDAIDSPRRRYPSEDVRHPEDVSHPHTTDDESSQSLRERITGGTSKIVLVAVGLVLAAVVGYGLLLFGSVVVDLATNRWVQAIVGALAVGGTALVVGAKRERRAIAETDTLEIMLPNGLKEFQGEYVETGTGPAFVPYKGRTGLLRSQEPFTLEDLSTELPRLDSKQGLDGDDHAVIELLDAYTSVAMTDRGVRVATTADGIQPAPFSSDVALRCEPPSLAHEDRLQDANAMIQELNDELATKQRRVGALMNRLNYLLEDNDTRRDEIRKEMTELFIDLSLANKPQSQRTADERDRIRHLSDQANELFGGESE